MMDPSNTNKGEGSTSSLVNYKVDEQLMGESLYRNLHVLARFYEPSAEFQLVFQTNMFIKSNAKAFFHVMHFIFNCIDAVEFNKRFRWPLLDRTGETYFRKASVDYMNHLNGIHQLGLETLQLSNINIPGGLKFIKIVHRFTCLAMKLEVNKPEHGSLPNMQSIPDGDDMLEKLEVYVDQGMNFITKLEAQSDKLSTGIVEMQAMMESCFDKPNAESNKKQICWTCLLKDWKTALECAIEDEVEPKLAVVNLFSKHAVQLNELLTKLFVEKKENLIEYDKDQLAAAQIVLKRMHPDFEQVIDGIVDGNIVNFENVFKVFSFILPKVMNKLETFECVDLDAMEYELNEIVQYDAITSKYHDDFIECMEHIKPFIEKDLQKFEEFCQNNFNLPFNLLQTPPVTRRSQVNRTRNRLGLVDDLLRKTQLFKEPPTTQLSQSRNTTLLRPTSCSSLNTYKSQDAALQLLSRPKSRGNLTQTSFRDMSTMSKFSTPKLSSTMAGNRKHQAELKFPSFASMTTPTRVFSENFTETTSMVSPNGISVVRKRESTSVIHLNQPHLLSPSRRLCVTDIPPEFAALMASGKLDEINIGTGMNAMDSVKIVTNGQEERIANGHQTSLKNRSIKAGTSSSPSVGIEDLPEDFIGNVSDSVLNDVLSE